MISTGAISFDRKNRYLGKMESGLFSESTSGLLPLIRNNTCICYAVEGHLFINAFSCQRIPRYQPGAKKNRRNKLPSCVVITGRKV